MKLITFPTNQVPAFFKWWEGIILSFIFSSPFSPAGVQENELNREFGFVRVTGGGSVKFEKEFKEKGIQFERLDEIESLIGGINFQLTNLEKQLFKLNVLNKNRTNYLNKQEASQLFPFILVNVGSGVNFHLIKDKSGERVSEGGSSIGGSVFWGLSNFLTEGRSSFSEVKEMAKEGEASKVDMTVGDIYGGDYHQLELPASVVAGSFGKLGDYSQEEMKSVKKSDVISSLLAVVCQHVSLLALEIAKRNSVSNIVFVGGLTHDNPSAQVSISRVVAFVGRGKFSPFFLQNDQHCGALGCLLYKNKNAPLQSNFDNQVKN